MSQGWGPGGECPEIELYLWITLEGGVCLSVSSPQLKMAVYCWLLWPYLGHVFGGKMKDFIPINSSEIGMNAPLSSKGLTHLKQGRTQSKYGSVWGSVQWHWGTEITGHWVSVGPSQHQTGRDRELRDKNKNEERRFKKRTFDRQHITAIPFTESKIFPESRKFPAIGGVRTQIGAPILGILCW